MEELKPICPVCGGKVEWNDTYDYSIYDGEYVDFCWGICQKCGEEVDYNIVFPLGEPKIVVTDHRKA